MTPWDWSKVVPHNHDHNHEEAPTKKKNQVSPLFFKKRKNARLRAKAARKVTRNIRK